MNPFRKKPLESPPDAPTPTPTTTPKSPPPVAPRRRRSQLKRPPADPFSSTPSDSDSDPFHHVDAPAPARQSLDAESFKRLMLGLSVPPPESSTSTDSSSVSRHSLFEPILECNSTPRTSHEDARPRAKLPPPPPKPRVRSGGKPEIVVDKAQSPPLPPASPPSPVPLLQKRVAPSPPLSRRHSVQSKVSLREQERPATPGKVKPPPPPVRRMKSVNARPGHGRSQSMTVGAMLPPPPPPPPPRSRAGSFEVNERGGEERAGVGSVEAAGTGSVEAKGSAEAKGSETKKTEETPAVQEEMDILVDLQKLQREVDELRGKYEGRKVSVGAEVTDVIVDSSH